MKKNQIIILKGRGLISIEGKDAKDFLQNILSNNINKVSYNKSIFSGIFNPQGKYLFEFFIIKSEKGYYIECEVEVTKDIIDNLNRYKLRSNIEIKDLSIEYAIGLIDLKKFKEIQESKGLKNQTIQYEEASIFSDPRSNLLGVRIILKLKKLHVFIKNLNLEIKDVKDYIKEAHQSGFLLSGMNKLKEQLFGLEANLDELNAIDFKKGCYIGQENTARMKLRKKIRKRLLPVDTDQIFKVGSEILFENKVVGKILISKPYPFALIKLIDPEFDKFVNQDLFIENKKIRIIKPIFLEK